MGERVVVLGEQQQFAEAARDVVADRLIRVHVGDRTARERLARLGVGPGGTRRLGDQCAEQAVGPGRERVDVIVEVGRAELGVRVPAVADELAADDLTWFVGRPQGLGEPHGVAVDRGDLRDLETLVQVHPHADERTCYRCSSDLLAYRRSARIHRRFRVIRSPRTRLRGTPTSERPGTFVLVLAMRDATRWGVPHGRDVPAADSLRPVHDPPSGETILLDLDPGSTHHASARTPS